jgi:hypothetical protein
MEQEFKLTNGDGYFTVMDEVDLKSGKKWRTVVLFTSNGTTKFDDIIIKPEDDESLILNFRSSFRPVFASWNH